MKEGLLLLYSGIVVQPIIPDISIVAGNVQKEKLTGLLDTGATSSAISSSLSEDLMLNSFQVSRMETAGKQAEETQNFRVDLISFAPGFEFHDISLAEFGSYRGLDLVIGMDIISKLEVTISHTDKYTFVSMQRNGNFSKEALFIPPIELPPIVYLNGEKIREIDFDAWEKKNWIE